MEAQFQLNVTVPWAKFGYVVKSVLVSKINDVTDPVCVVVVSVASSAEIVLAPPELLLIDH